MQIFNDKLKVFFNQFGTYKKLVLSTSLNDKVTSRMMSIVVINKKFYFQTDKNFRKYEQLMKNPNVSLCIDNIEIEGVCREIGHPLDLPDFCNLYEKYFKSSYERYSSLSDERLFVIDPAYIKKWIYKDNKPFIEIFDLKNNVYKEEAYKTL